MGMMRNEVAGTLINMRRSVIRENTAILNGRLSHLRQEFATYIEFGMDQMTAAVLVNLSDEQVDRLGSASIPLFRLAIDLKTLYTMLSAVRSKNGMTFTSVGSSKVAQTVQNENQVLLGNRLRGIHGGLQQRLEACTVWGAESILSGEAVDAFADVDPAEVISVSSMGVSLVKMSLSPRALFIAASIPGHSQILFHDYLQLNRGAVQSGQRGLCAY